MANIAEEYRLNAAAVDEIADKIQRYLETNKATRRDALRFRLAMEEVLLRILEFAGDDPIAVTLLMGKRFGRQSIVLRWTAGTRTIGAAASLRTLAWLRHGAGAGVSTPSSSGRPRLRAAAGFCWSPRLLRPPSPLDCWGCCCPRISGKRRTGYC